MGDIDMKNKYKFCTIILFSMIASVAWGEGILVRNISGTESLVCLQGLSAGNENQFVECASLKPKEIFYYNNSKFSKADKLKFTFLEKSKQPENTFRQEDAVLVNNADGNKINQSEYLKKIFTLEDNYEFEIDDVLDRSIVVKKVG